MQTCCITDARTSGMRTTVRLDPEVAAAAEQLRRQHGTWLSEVVNQLARAGLMAGTAPRGHGFEQRTAALGLQIDVSNVAEALENLDGLDHA